MPRHYARGAHQLAPTNLRQPALSTPRINYDCTTRTSKKRPQLPPSGAASGFADAYNPRFVTLTPDKQPTHTDYSQTCHHHDTANTIHQHCGNAAPGSPRLCCTAAALGGRRPWGRRAAALARRLAVSPPARRAALPPLAVPRRAAPASPAAAPALPAAAPAPAAAQCHGLLLLLLLLACSLLLRGVCGLSCTTSGPPAAAGMHIPHL